MLAGIACLNLALAATPVAAAQRSAAFCGTPPPGWTPPGQRKPAAPQMPGGLCHVMLCGSERGKMRPR
ncbi:hypothetical protein GL174_09500 [Sphingobium sp. CAP-1]|nr:hypothetical protein GL174_09500 [Sphingobium sp. CAP-1]